jgi:branched-chain amino acid transport system permease protein
MTWGGHYLMGILAGMLLIAVIAVVMEWLVFRPLESGPHVAGFIGALGLFLVLENSALIWFGEQYRIIRSPYTMIPVQIGPIMLNAQRLLVLFSGIAISVSAYLFLRKTRIGKQIRAVSQNKDAATLIGIDSNMVNITAFALSGVLAAAAGGLVSPMSLVAPSMGMMPITKAFVVVVLGGMGSIPGAIFGGFLLGLVESLGAGYISSAYKDCFAFGLLVLVLMIKPSGLFGTGELRE